MKKSTGVALGILGTIATAIGIGIAVKSGKKDNYVDVTNSDIYDDYDEECTEVEIVKD
jgi:hypothetical protein